MAVAAVDRHDAADVAAAKDVTAVRIVLLYAAAGKATGQTAHKPAAEHVALAGLAAVQHNFLAVADKAADEITLEGAGVGQCAGFFVKARLDLLLELGLGQVAAGHAFAPLQGHAPAVARNAAEELPQHQAARIARGIAFIVGARADRAVVPQARQARGAGICACRKQVADDAARKAVASHKAVVDDVRLVRRLHLRGVHRAEHAAHADAAPEGVLVTRLGCRSGVAGLLGLLVCRCGLCNGLHVLVHKQTRYRHVRRDGQILHDGIRFGYGNADETANAARLVCIIGIAFAVSVQRLLYALRCGGFVVKRQRRGHQRTGRGVRAAGQGAVFQRAGVDAAECADGANIAPVLVVGILQRRDEFCGRQPELVCIRQRIGGDGLGLDVDLNVRVAQCDVRNFALVLTDKADIVVGQLVLLCPAGFCNGLAAQLQIEDGHTGRLGCKDRCLARKYDIFAQLRDRRPGDRVIEGRHLGRRPCARGAVDRDAAARPVQAGAVAGLGGQRVGALVGNLPIRRPAQVVQMAEIFQVCRNRRAALGQQGVFLVRHFLFAGCVGVAVVLPRLGAHGNVDVLRVVQQAGDAVQARGGNVSVVLTRAQQRRVRHGVQRQHKAALVVA